MIRSICMFCLFLALAGAVTAQTFKSVEIDRHKNVLATSIKGHKFPLTKEGRLLGINVAVKVAATDASLDERR